MYNFNHMMSNFNSFFQSSSTLPWGFPAFWGPIFGLLLAWSLVWKGVALWKSARQGKKIWFVVLLLVDTLGILDILYIYVFSKKFKSVEK